MHFDEQAKIWDTEKRIKRAKTISNEIGKYIPERENLSAMEFGCGTGLMSFNLKDKFGKITLIDYSAGMIEVVNEKIKSQNIGFMQGIQLDLTKADLNIKFDVIYSSMVLHHIKDVKLILKKLSSLLNENGKLIIIEIDEEDGGFHKSEEGFDGHNGFSHVEFEKILLENEMKKIQINTFYHDSKEIEQEKIDYSLFVAVSEKK